MGHLYNKIWSTTNFHEGAKEYKYRCVVLRDGVKVCDKIDSIFSLSEQVTIDLIKSWNINYKNLGIEYIYCLA
jgi:hypothetical protein